MTTRNIETMIRSISTTFALLLLFVGNVLANNDSLQGRNYRIGLTAHFMGIGYHGYLYPEQNFAVTVGAEAVGRYYSNIRPYCNLGAGFTTIYTIGYTTLSSGIFIGRRTSFLRIGAALAVAFTQHEVYWQSGMGHTGSSGSIKIPWGAQVIPTVGYTYLPSNKGVIASFYLSPHFALPTYEAPGTVNKPFVFSVGISVGFIH